LFQIYLRTDLKNHHYKRIKPQPESGELDNNSA
jgi:hypothetical protein